MVNLLFCLCTRSNPFGCWIEQSPDSSCVEPVRVTTSCLTSRKDSSPAPHGHWIRDVMHYLGLERTFMKGSLERFSDTVFVTNMEVERLIIRYNYAWVCNHIQYSLFTTAFLSFFFFFFPPSVWPLFVSFMSGYCHGGCLFVFVCTCYALRKN